MAFKGPFQHKQFCDSLISGFPKIVVKACSACVCDVALPEWGPQQHWVTVGSIWQTALAALTMWALPGRGWVCPCLCVPVTWKPYRKPSPVRLLGKIKVFSGKKKYTFQTQIWHGFASPHSAWPHTRSAGAHAPPRSSRTPPAPPTQLLPSARTLSAGTRLPPCLLSAEGAARPGRAGRRGRRGRGGDVGAPPPRPAAPHGAGAGAGLRQRLRGRRGDHTSARRRRAWRAPRRPPAAAAAAAPRSPTAPPAAPRRPAAARRRQRPWRSRSGRLRPRG